MTTVATVVIISNMEATLLVDRRLVQAEDVFVELVLWQVPQPVRGWMHGYKYRLAYVVAGVCVLRYDNETGMGAYRYRGVVENPYHFITPEQLLTDFNRDVKRWNHENDRS